MKKSITRIITFMMAAAVFASIAVTGVSASPDAPEFMLALGDSITTGYGLEDYYDGGTPYECNSYVNQIANALGLKGGDSYVNKAVNGATSTDMLNILPDLTNYLGYADLIVVTIGGNDLLQSIPIVASALAGKNITRLEDSIEVLTSVTPDKFAALATNTNFQTKMGAVLAKYATNLAAIGGIIKENAPDAHVLFLKQYNPMKNVLGFADFGNFADTLIASVNTAIETVCAAHGFDIVDAPSVIDINAVGLTNILNYDIHPNAMGHDELAKLVADHLGISLDPSENTTAPETDITTEPETDPTTAPEATDEPTEAPSTETEPQLEAPGCFSSISSAAIILASVFALVVIKKNND